MSTGAQRTQWGLDPVRHFNYNGKFIYRTLASLVPSSNGSIRLPFSSLISTRVSPFCDRPLTGAQHSSRISRRDSRTGSHGHHRHLALLLLVLFLNTPVTENTEGLSLSYRALSLQRDKVAMVGVPLYELEWGETPAPA